MNRQHEDARHPVPSIPSSAAARSWRAPSRSWAVVSRRPRRPRRRPGGLSSPRAVAQTAEGQYATINGADLYYELHGPADGPAGDAAARQLHGSTEGWWNQVTTFAAAGYRVVTFDARARGRSTWGDLPPTIPQLALDALGLLDHLGIAHADVVGWSSGGNVALELAVNHADRLDRVVVYGATYDTTGRPRRDPLQRRDAPLGGDASRTTSGCRRSPSGCRSSSISMPPTRRNFSEAELGSITVPVLVLDGAEEEFVDPEHTKRMAALIPGSQLVLMPGTGHFAPLAHPGEFNRIVLAFLAGEEVGPSTSPAA